MNLVVDCWHNRYPQEEIGQYPRWVVQPWVVQQGGDEGIPPGFGGIPIFLLILDPSFPEFYLFPFFFDRKTEVAGSYSDDVTL
jgi:hypothetical protein